MRQAVPLIQPEAPVVGTGRRVSGGHVRLPARSSSPRTAGTVVSVTGGRHPDRAGGGGPARHAPPASSSCAVANQGTCIDQRPSSSWAPACERVGVGRFLGSTDQGELALGQNVLVAFMPGRAATSSTRSSSANGWSTRTMFTSIHIEKHETEARDTKLGPEEITRDIPNVGEDSLRNLDEDGIISMAPRSSPAISWSARSRPGRDRADPGGALLRAIFGEKAREVNDKLACGCRTGSAGRGRCREFNRETDELLPGWTASSASAWPRSGRSPSATRWPVATATRAYLQDPAGRGHAFHGGRHAGRHPPQPARRAGRMNIGQILETHLGWAAARRSA